MPSIQDDLKEVVRATLQGEVPTINNMLKCIAERFGAFGCGLWEETSQQDENEKFLITVAAWWESGEIFAMDDVPIGDSPTGRAILTGKGALCNDIDLEGGAKKNHPFWKKHHVKFMCAVPLTFMDEARGALNVYRAAKSNSNPFTEEDLARLKAIASVIPGLYRAVRERVGLDLIRRVGDLLRDGEVGETRFPFRRNRRPELMTTQKVRAVLASLCDAVSKAFDCVETTVFLESTKRSQSHEFKAMASTSWESFQKRRYQLFQDGNGQFLTGWVLANWLPVIVPDLGKLERYRSKLQQNYPGIARKDDPRDLNRAKNLLKLAPEDDLPPLSWMAAPIFGGVDWFGGTDLRGVIRCHMARSGPYFFSEREQQLLEVIANQVGQWWARWRVRTEMEFENKAWEQLVKLLAKLNKATKAALRTSLNETDVFQQTVVETARVFTAVKWVTVRIMNPKTSTLSIVAANDAAKTLLMGLKGSLEVPCTTLDPGWKSFKQRKLVTVRREPPDKPIDSAFKETDEMIAAPIGVDDECFGVLELRWHGCGVPQHARQAAQLIGQQLGIYHQLFEFVNKERTALAETERNKTQEARAYEDFAHQLRSPIAQASEQIELLFSEFPGIENIQRRWKVARGLVRRSKRVATSMRIFTEFARGLLPKHQLLQLSRDEWLNRMINLADDTQMYAAQRHPLQFRVDRASFSLEFARQVRIDPDMLEQMMANLLDNAAKYSHSQTTVRIFAGIAKNSGRPYIAVANRGFPFRRGETELAKTRGWRSQYAKMTGSDGQGIGLWLVDQMMKLHKGELDIISPNASGENEFHMYFPPSSSSIP